MNGGGDGDGAGTGVEANERTQDENRDGSEDGAGTGTGTRTGVKTRGRTQNGNGDGSWDENESSCGDGNEDRIGGGGGKTKRHRKPHESCKRDVGNGGDLGGNRGKRRQKSIGSVAADPDNLENRKKAERQAQGTQSLSKNCTGRKSASPLSRLVRGFHYKYH